METMETAKPKGFAYGKHIVMRPVKKENLVDLATLKSQCPHDGTSTPWTLQRLTNEFEKKDEPGLWGSKTRHFCILSNSGELVGYIRETDDSSVCISTIAFHVMDGVSNWNELATDLLRTYLKHKQTWNNQLRVNCMILKAEKQKAASLEASGFELELTRERMVLHLGKPEAVCTYSWMSRAHLDAPAWDVPAVASEEARKK